MTKTTFGFLDNDMYAFTMSQAAWKNNRNTRVRYRFRNRSFSVPLASRVGLDVLRDAIEEVRNDYVATDEDLDYLRSTGLFTTEYLYALRDVRLPEVELGDDNGHLVATYEADWWQAIFWETPLLYTVNQSYYARFGSDRGVEGRARLDDKVEWLGQNPQITFADMGTRRRYSPYTHRAVIARMAEDTPNLVGTSNVHLAREFDLKPIGTMAHQMFMVNAALAIDKGENINTAQQRVLTQWEDLYESRPEMMTFLPDTYGTDYFLAGMPAERMAKWTGIRQDSGDPLVVCANMIRWMRANNIDPKDKRILPSDGLDLRRMAVLHDTFSPHTNVSFGFGTGLTNDAGYEPLSIVVKPDAVLLVGDELPCVKISDTPEKATGTPEAIAHYKKLLGLEEL